jgi:hypothetical protein
MMACVWTSAFAGAASAKSMEAKFVGDVGSGHLQRIDSDRYVRIYQQPTIIASEAHRAGRRRRPSVLHAAHMSRYARVSCPIAADF